MTFEDPKSDNGNAVRDVTVIIRFYDQLQQEAMGAEIDWVDNISGLGSVRVDSIRGFQ